MLGPPELAAGLAQVGDLVNGVVRWFRPADGTRVEIFQNIYWLFLILGTLVGVVVIGYMVYNAYKYRDREDRGELEDPPQLGETPTGGGKGRKLFLSFSLSAIIVISLIVGTYGTLLLVEGQTVAADTGLDEMEYVAGEEITVYVEGYQFGWRFQYPNGANATNTLRVPQDTRVNLIVTSSDVHHNFWLPEQRAKADAIPGQRTATWFEAERTGTYTAQCAELCGAGHSYMNADVVVLEQGEFDQWYANQSEQ